MFAVQDETAHAIVGALRAKLPGAAGPQLGRPVSSPGTTNPDAYDLYLRASYLLERRGSGVAKAVEYFERAIAEDNGFARAYAGLGYSLELLASFGGTTARAVERRAVEAAHRALAIDSTLAEAHTALGIAHIYAFRWPEAGRRSSALSPSTPATRRASISMDSTCSASAGSQTRRDTSDAAVSPTRCRGRRQDCWRTPSHSWDDTTSH